MTSTIYPLGIDGFAQLPVLIDGVSPVRAEDVNRLRTALIAIQTELGTEPSGSYDSVRLRLDEIESLLAILSGIGSLIAQDVSLEDGDGYFSSENVEEALREIGLFINNVLASDIHMSDGYFDSTNVENVLIEISEFFSNLTAAQVGVVDSDGYYLSDNVEGSLQEVGHEITELLTDYISGMIEEGENKTYYLSTNTPFNGQIQSITAQCTSGTATGTIHIEGVALAVSNSISSTETIVSPEGANFSIGNEISLVLTASTTPLDIRFTVVYTRDKIV